MKKPKKNQRADAAYLKAVQEIEKDRIEEVKVIVKKVLEGIVKAEKEERQAKETLTLLKQDLDDIRHGKIEKIKERHAKAEAEKRPVPFDAEKLHMAFLASSTTTSDNANAQSIGSVATSGDFTLTDGTRVKIGNVDQ